MGFDRPLLPTEQAGPGRPMELEPREVANAMSSTQFCTSCGPDASGETSQVTFQTPIASIIIIGNGASMGPGAGLIGSYLDRSELDATENRSQLEPFSTAKASRPLKQAARVATTPERASEAANAT